MAFSSNQTQAILHVNQYADFLKFKVSVLVELTWLESKVDKSLHFSFFAKKRRKFQNLCKESKEIAKEKIKILTVF